VLTGERARTLADEQHRLVVLGETPGERDRIRDARHGGHRAATETIAFHDRRVHLHRARRGQHGAAPGVERRIVLERANGRLHRVDGPAARGENAPAGQHGGRHAGTERRAVHGGIGTRTAVHDDGRNAARWCHGPHGVTIASNCKNAPRSSA
jgi:hypothetical protein